MIMISDKLINDILSFRDLRNWKQFHNPKDLAISISLEAAELLEVFQWSGEETGIEGKKKEAADELADVMMYSILMADACGFDIEKILADKLEKNIRKYPVRLAYGSSEKYTELKKKGRE